MSDLTKMIKINCCWLGSFLFALLFSGTVYGSSQLQVGAVFPPIEATDQHGEEYRFEAGTQWVLVSFDMATGKAANRFFAEQGGEFLPQQGAIFIADIFDMPRIGRMFALPKMRRYPHRIILADQQRLLDPFPRREGAITVMRMDEAGFIRAIGYWQPGQTGWQDMLGSLEAR